MPTYKLIYFNVKGLGELSRFIFAHSEVQYEDKRITHSSPISEEWAEMKPTTPYGSLPVLEVDGKQLAGSQVIARFLAERFGLAGSNDFENADIAGINDVIGDLISQLTEVFFEEDEGRQAELLTSLKEKHLPRYLGVLEKRAQISGAPEGWLWGKLTWPDFNFYITIGFVEEMVPEALKNFPTLTQLKVSVESLPNIAKWLNERPQSDH